MSNVANMNAPTQHDPGFYWADLKPPPAMNPEGKTYRTVVACVVISQPSERIEHFYAPMFAPTFTSEHVTNLERIHDVRQVRAL